MRPFKQAYKTILIFFISVMGLYTLFVIGWYGIQDHYSSAFRAVGNVVFDTHFDNGFAAFMPFDSPQDIEKDTIIFLFPRQGTKVDRSVRGRVTIDTRYYGYIPVSIVLALVLVTPIPWRRRWRIIVAGLVLSHILIYLRLWVIIADTFFLLPKDALLYPGFLKTIISGCSRIFLYFENSFIFPVLVWIFSCILTTRPRDWQQIFAYRNDEQTAKV